MVLRKVLQLDPAIARDAPVQPLSIVSPALVEKPSGEEAPSKGPRCTKCGGKAQLETEHTISRAGAGDDSPILEFEELKRWWDERDRLELAALDQHVRTIDSKEKSNKSRARGETRSYDKRDQNDYESGLTGCLDSDADAGTEMGNGLQARAVYTPESTSDDEAEYNEDPITQDQALESMATATGRKEDAPQPVPPCTDSDWWKHKKLTEEDADRHFQQTIGWPGLDFIEKYIIDRPVLRPTSKPRDGDQKLSNLNWKKRAKDYKGDLYGSSEDGAEVEDSYLEDATSAIRWYKELVGCCSASHHLPLLAQDDSTRAKSSATGVVQEENKTVNGKKQANYTDSHAGGLGRMAKSGGCQERKRKESKSERFMWID
ncbi:hypothetical protein B0A50_00035 [Salinomyces thailandicus]|uniref:Uncharacterized protein n=1 Tax=Salinomyces thailandicus TaxID=706561 RepID=A0A4U0UHN3_9PEZI|nr:hypothetical protein B0A50_00035 [Salinomyces thailandica]